MVCGINSSDNYQFRLDLLHHLIEISENRTIYTHDIFSQFQPSGVNVTESYKLNVVLIIIDYPFPPEIYTPDAGTYHGKLFFRLPVNGCTNRSCQKGSTCGHACSCGQKICSFHNV